MRPEIIHPNLLPAHEQDMWRAAFAAAMAANRWSVFTCAQRADDAVRALRDVALERLRLEQQ